MFYELSRHFYHYLVASKKYQILKSHESSPELPSRNNSMILLSFFKQACFWIVNPLLEKNNSS